MLLTVDIGNTSCKFGIFDEDGKEISLNFFDEAKSNYRSLILSIIYKANLREENITKAILSCVVPKVYNQVFDDLLSIVGKGNVIDIDANNYYGITLDCPKQEIGDDIIVMSSYAYNLYKQELIVVSIGTCTVLTHVSSVGVFKHCIIAPGLKGLHDSIFNNAAMLDKTNINKPSNFLANNTIDAINIGAYKGYIGMLKYLIAGLKKDIGNQNVKIIGCGGCGKQIIDELDEIDIYEPDFVSKGLNYIYEKYYKK